MRFEQESELTCDRLPDDIPVRTLDPGTYGYTTWMTAMFWSDPVALYLASGLMLSRCEAAGVSLHDTKILVNFMSQRVANPDFYRVSTPRPLPLLILIASGRCRWLSGLCPSARC